MKRAIPYALYTTGALIAYFFLMKLLGLEKNFYLRIFNFFILGGGIYFLYYNTFKKDSQERIGYIQSLMSGALLTLISVVSFIVIMGIYILVFDPAFLEALAAESLWASSQSSKQVVVIGVLIEGISSGFIISFVLMQYFKASIPSRDSV